MPTITFIFALLFASFAPASTNHHVKNERASGKVTTKGKPNNGDYIVHEDIMP